MAEWLRRSTRNRLTSCRIGSSPVGSEVMFCLTVPRGLRSCSIVLLDGDRCRSTVLRQTDLTFSQHTPVVVKSTITTYLVRIHHYQNGCCHVRFKINFRNLWNVVPCSGFVCIPAQMSLVRQYSMCSCPARTLSVKRSTGCLSAESASFLTVALFANSAVNLRWMVQWLCSCFSSLMTASTGLTIGL